MKRFLALWLILILTSWPLVPEAARTFVDGQMLSTDAAIVSVPMTMCAWVRTSAASTAQGVMGVGTAGSNNNAYALFISNGTLFSIRVSDAGGSSDRAFGGALTLNTWYHLCGRWSDATTADMFRNGVLSAGTHTRSPSGMNTTMLARYALGTSTLDLNGSLGVAAFWSAALTTAEVAALASGVHPRKVRPDASSAVRMCMGAKAPSLMSVGRGSGRSPGRRVKRRVARPSACSR